jgi:hypothetical protein
MNLGVYCETLSPPDLVAPDIVALLGEFGATLALAVRFIEPDGKFMPERVFPYLELGAKLREAGARLALWPLTPKEMGYWINERNLDAVDRMIDAVLEGCRRFGARPDLLVADIESPWTEMEKVFFPGPPIWRRLMAGAAFLVRSRNPRRFAWASRRLTDIVRRAQGEDIPVSAAVFPFLVADLVAAGSALQDYLEMPVFAVPFDGFNAMIYNSYLPAAAPLIVPPGSEQRFTYEYAGELSRFWGAKAWVTLGSTWEGVIPGNEGKAYREARELAPDVAAVRAAGIETIWLYCLEGVLFSDQKLTARRPRDESAAFFTALRDTPAATPAPHVGWTRGRRVLEILARDHRRGGYGW